MFILGRERKGFRGLFPKIRSFKTNRKFENIKFLKQVEELEIFVKISKLVFKTFAFIFLPIFLLLVVILAVMFAVWHWFNPTNSDLLHVTNSLSDHSFINLNNNLSDLNLVGGFVESVLDAVCAVLYVIFITPILWVLSSFQVIIVYMASGGLLNEFLFGNNSTFLNVPKSFVIVSGIAIGLMTLFFTLKMFEVMNAKHNIKAMKLKSGVTNVLFAIIGVGVIPIMFIILNTLIIGITKIIAESGNLSTTDLGLTVFNSSFSDKIQNFKEVPKWIGFEYSKNFSYFICIIAEIFVCYSMFLIGIMLIWNAFELLILFCISPLPIVWCIEDEGKRFRAWKEVTIARFINIAIIFLTYTIFIASLGVFAKISNNMPTTASRPVFIMLGLFAGVTAVIKAPSMLAGVLGNHNMALSEGLSTIIGMKAVTGGIKTVGGALLFGSKRKRINMARSLGEKANLVNTAGGVVGASRIVKHGYSAIKNHDEKIKSTALAAGALVGAFTGTIVGGTSLALKLNNHIEKNRNLKSDNEKVQRQENELKSHIRSLEEWFRLIFNNLNTNDVLISLLEELLFLTYKNHKITILTKLKKLKNNQWPTLQKLYETACNKFKDSKYENEQQLLSFLKQLSNVGAYGELWNGYTTLDVKDDKFIIFDTYNLRKNRNIINAQLFLMLQFLENEVIKNKNHNEKLKEEEYEWICIAVDEAHLLINQRNLIALQFLYEMVKIIRKYHVIIKSQLILCI